MNEIQRSLDLRRVAIDPEGSAAAFAVRHVGTLRAGGGGVYGQPDLVDALHPAESEAFLTRAGETAQKTTRFLSEWQRRWGMQSEDDSSQRTECTSGL
jgi:hypothetical protein